MGFIETVLYLTQYVAQALIFVIWVRCNQHLVWASVVSHGDNIHSSVPSVNHSSCSGLWGRCPSCHRARGGANPVQITNLLQGRNRETDNH